MAQTILIRSVIAQKGQMAERSTTLLKVERAISECGKGGLTTIGPGTYNITRSVTIFLRKRYDGVISADLYIGK